MASHFYQRLRHGQKHVILAIVNQGIISYLRVADSDFGQELLYLQQGPRKGSKGQGGKRKNQKGSEAKGKACPPQRP